MKFGALLEKFDEQWRQAMEAGLVLPVMIALLGAVAVCLAVPALRQRTRRPIAMLGFVVLFAAGSLWVARMAESKREAKAERERTETGRDAAGRPIRADQAGADKRDSLVSRFLSQGQGRKIEKKPRKEAGRVVINVRKGDERQAARRAAAERAWLDGYEKLKRQQTAEARKSFEEARRKFGDVGDERATAEEIRGQALALQGMARASRSAGRPGEAVGEYAAARDAFLKSGERSGRIDAAETEVEIAETQHDLGDSDSAKAAFKSALTQYDKLADEAKDEAARLAGDAYRRYATFAQERQEHDEARKAAEKAAEHYEKVRGTLDRAWADVSIAEIDAGAGRVAEARKRIAAARKALREHGALEAEADALLTQGRIELAAGDVRAAEAAFAEVAALHRARKDARGEARALQAAAVAFRRAERPKEAQAAFAAADQAFLRARDRRGRAALLLEWGRLEAEAGRVAAAVPFLAEAESLYRELGVLRLAAQTKEEVERHCRGLADSADRPEPCRILADRSGVPTPHRMGPR